MNRLKKRGTIENKGLRVCLGAMNSTLLQPLRVKANEPQLNIRREFLAHKYVTTLNIKNIVKVVERK